MLRGDSVSNSLFAWSDNFGNLLRPQLSNIGKEGFLYFSAAEDSIVRPAVTIPRSILKFCDHLDVVDQSWCDVVLDVGLER